MGVTVNGHDKLARQFESAQERIHEQTVRVFARLGEIGTNHAKDLPREVSYNDVTANLRNSIGYGVWHNGQNLITKVERKAVGKVASDIDPKEVTVAAMDLELASTPDEYVTLITAGMEYASELEARGRDVLTSARYMVEEQAKSDTERLKTVIVNMLKGIAR